MQTTYITPRQQTLNMSQPPPMQTDIRTAEQIELITYPTNTYRLLYDIDRIQRDIDGLPAVEQFIYKVVHTERYEFLIYDWNYGIELKDLFGMPKTFARAELPRRITEGLITDDRIVSVRAFVFDDTLRSGAVKISYTVETIYGDLQINSLYNHEFSTLTAYEKEVA